MILKNQRKKNLSMKNQTISIPYFRDLTLKHIVLDYNGTIAKDGILKSEVKERLPLLTQNYHLHVITSDTFGSVKEQLKDFDVTIKVLSTDDHTLEKATYIEVLGGLSCVAIGNGNNDVQMLNDATLSIALLGDEGCSRKALMNSDIVCTEIADALDLLLNEKRLIATLRK